MEDGFELMPGEVINLKLERVGVFYGSTCGLEPQGGHGSLLVTNYQMSFNWGGKKPINVPHLTVAKVTKRDRATDKRAEDWDESSGSAANPLTHKIGMVQLERRDTTAMTVIIFAASTLIDDVNDELYPNPTRQCAKLFDCLMSYVFPRSLTKVFAFSNRLEVTAENDGWRVYNPEEEFSRQGVLSAGSGWRISHVNHEYSACESYPRKVGVPAGIRDWEIKKALEFRANGRFPIMVWKNPRGDSNLADVTRRDATVFSVICRSAQPLPGLFRMRNKEDERLVTLIRAANPSPAPLYIIDARPHTNAQANTVFRAAGYERGSYENCEIIFLGMENIHNVRKSYVRLRELCSAPADDDERWLHNISETYWLQHLSKLLQGGRRIAELVMLERASVLIHCSDGWDRTPQISALAQLMVDPYYRTIRGFAVLVEKEWCSMGHKFSLRYAHGGSSDKQEAAPVLAQWADGIWQMMRQFPTAFEFSEALLLELIDMAYVCKFGSFLFNSESERRRAGVHKRTVSFWSHVLTNLDKYTNAHYIKYPGLIFPETNVRRLWLWEGLFFRDCTSLPPPQDRCPALSLGNEATTSKAHISALEAEVRELKLRNAELLARCTEGSSGMALSDNVSHDAADGQVHTAGNCTEVAHADEGEREVGVGAEVSREMKGLDGPRRDKGAGASGGEGESLGEEGGRNGSVKGQGSGARENWELGGPGESGSGSEDSAAGSTTDGGTTETYEVWLKSGGGGENPLQQPFGSKPAQVRASDGSGSDSGRRRRRGAREDGGIFGVPLEAPLDETSAKWIPDQGVTQCLGCNKSFDMFNRRHHCRCCGRIFCDKCSSFRSRISRMQIEQEVRVCARCFKNLQAMEVE